MDLTLTKEMIDSMTPRDAWQYLEKLKNEVLKKDYDTVSEFGKKFRDKRIKDVELFQRKLVVTYSLTDLPK